MVYIVMETLVHAYDEYDKLVHNPNFNGILGRVSAVFVDKARALDYAKKQAEFFNEHYGLAKELFSSGSDYFMANSLNGSKHHFTYIVIERELVKEDV